MSKADLLDGKDQDHKVDPGRQGEAPTNSLIQACTSLMVSQHPMWLHSIWFGPSKEAERVISPRSRLKCIRRDSRCQNQQKVLNALAYFQATTTSAY